MKNEELRKKLKHYFSGEITTKASFAEIYNANEEILIKTETSIERLVYSKDIIRQADNITGMLNHMSSYSISNNFYQTINLNNLSKTIYESAVINKSPTFIEIVLNRNCFRSNSYIHYLSNKYDKHNSFLIPEVYHLRFPYYFYYDEINIEFSSPNNYLFHQLSNFFTVISFEGKYSDNGRANILSLSSMIKLIDNEKMLNVLSYFHEMCYFRIRLGDYTTKFSRYHKAIHMNNSHYFKIAINNWNNCCKSLSQNKTMEDIKNELVTKEQMLTKMIIDDPHHYDHYTHFYINDHTMSDKDIINIGTWLIYSKAKLFAWHLNPEDTKKIGLKVTKVATLPKLNNLHIYLKLK